MWWVSLFIWWDMETFLMFSIIFSFHTHFPSRLNFCRVYLGSRSEYNEKTQHSAPRRLYVRQGTTKNENELIRPPRVMLPTFLSDKSQMYMRIENPELMFIALPCWVSSIWYEFIASCSHYTFYCLQSNKRSSATLRFVLRLPKQLIDLS